MGAAAALGLAAAVDDAEVGVALALEGVGNKLSSDRTESAPEGVASPFGFVCSFCASGAPTCKVGSGVSSPSTAAFATCMATSARSLLAWRAARRAVRFLWSLPVMVKVVGSIVSRKAETAKPAPHR